MLRLGCSWPNVSISGTWMLAVTIAECGEWFTKELLCLWSGRLSQITRKHFWQFPLKSEPILIGKSYWADKVSLATSGGSNFLLWFCCKRPKTIKKCHKSEKLLGVSFMVIFFVYIKWRAFFSPWFTAKVEKSSSAAFSFHREEIKVHFDFLLQNPQAKESKTSGIEETRKTLRRYPTSHHVIGIIINVVIRFYFRPFSILFIIARLWRLSFMRNSVDQIHKMSQQLFDGIFKRIKLLGKMPKKGVQEAIRSKYGFLRADLKVVHSEIWISEGSIFKAENWF